MTSFTLDPIFASPLFLLALAVATLAVPWIVPVAGRSVAPNQRKTLQWLRTGTAVILLLAVFRPSVVRTDSLPTEATLAVLLDRSRSMTLPADDKRTRAALQNELYQKLLPAIKELDGSLVLKTFVYAGDLTELSLDPAAASQLIASPTGDATDISGALAGAIEAATGRPLAGVVLIGDGVEVLPPSDRDRSQTRDRQAGSRLLQNLDVPLWPIAIGPPGDLDQVRDLEVVELGESFGLFSGNEATVEFVVRARALAGKACALRVTMTSEEPNAKANEIAIRTVTPSGPDDSIPMSIPIVAPAPGRYLMEVRVEAQEGESLLTNNSQIAFVDVRQGGGRVLYLEGQPRPEQQFLLRALRRFPDLQVNYRWIANDSQEHWPIDLALGEPANQYDLVIIGDLSAKAIGDTQLKQIVKRTGDGAALLMIGGTDNYANGAYEKSPLGSVLPIKLDPSQKDLTGEVRAQVTKSHPIIDLNPSGNAKDQADVWRKLPPFIGANRFADIRLAPGIEVLLETAASDPLLVVSEYGSGRIAAFAADSTWRWWRQGKSLEHRRFWRQMMLWLLNREFDSSDSIDIKLAQRRATVGQAIPFAIRYPNNDLPTQPSLELSVIGADGTVTLIQPDAVTPGTDQEPTAVDGKLSGFAPGLYRLRAGFKGSEKSNVERSFQVLDQDAELRQSFADHSYLSQLASQTATSGGAMFLPSDLDELIDLITQLRRNSEAPVVQKYRLADSGYSAWPLFVVLASLLSIEWYLRRRWGLA